MLREDLIVPTIQLLLKNVCWVDLVQLLDPHAATVAFTFLNRISWGRNKTKRLEG